MVLLFTIRDLVPTLILNLLSVVIGRIGLNLQLDKSVFVYEGLLCSSFFVLFVFSLFWIYLNTLIELAVWLKFKVYSFVDNLDR